MKYIYLDWNVIQYMHHSIVQGSINGPELEALIKTLYKKYKFPFSEGHLKDLSISDHPDNQDNIKSDLKYLNDISQGYALRISGPDEKITPVRCDNIYNLYKEIVNEPKPSIDAYAMGGDNYTVDMDSLPKNDLFKPFLEENYGTLNKDVMLKALQNLWQNIDNPDYYKKFRQQCSEIKKKFENGNTIIDTNSEYFKKLVPFLDFITSENPEDYLNDFDSVIQSFRHITNESIEGMTIGKKGDLTYTLLDFHPNYRDKINKKNRPSNIHRDCKNLYFASQAEYYITEDRSTRKKAEFVCRALSLKVKICSMSEFLAKFS